MRDMFQFKRQLSSATCLVACFLFLSDTRSQCAATSSNQSDASEGAISLPPPSISTSFVIDGVHHVVQSQESSSESLNVLAEGRAQRPKSAGKILDYLTSGGGSARDRHHLLAPRRSANSSASLLRLVVAPFKPALRINQEMRSRSASGAYENRSRDNLADHKRTGRYGGILREAKNLLSSGFQSIEQRAGSILNMGSGLVAALIPLASLMGGNKAGPFKLGNPNDHSNNSTGATPHWLPPKLAQFTPSANMLQNKLEYVLGLLERSSERLPTFPSLHPEECIKRSVCEAHYEPAKYGAIGLILRALIPASDKDNMEFTVINKYRRAGDVGLKSRRDTNATLVSALWDSADPSANPCKKQYEDCIVNLLDVAKNMVDLFVA